MRAQHLFLALLLAAPATAASSSRREELFDAGWSFYRGPDPNLPPNATECGPDLFCCPKFDDAAWPTIELPHDWSADDLPPRAADPSTPVLEVRNGTWQFLAGDCDGGDDDACADPDFDDAAWTPTDVPGDWREPPLSYRATNATGWCVVRVE